MQFFLRQKTKKPEKNHAEKCLKFGNIEAKWQPNNAPKLLMLRARGCDVIHLLWGCDVKYGVTNFTILASGTRL